MGKGNRNKTGRVADRYNNPEKYQNKHHNTAGTAGQLPRWVAIVAIVAIAAILVTSIAVSVIYEGGYVLRGKTAMKSDHYEINGTMLQYYFQYQYQSTYQNYYNMAVSYLGSAEYMSMFGFSVNTQYALDDETKNACGSSFIPEKDSETKKYDSVALYLRGGSTYTWWDYFMDQALKQAKSDLMYAEAAYAEGYETLESLDQALKEADPDRDTNAVEEIEEAMDDLPKTARSYGYTSVKSYLTAMYGTGVTKEDLRDAVELTYIASSYKELNNLRIENAVTDSDVNTKFDEDSAEGKYLYADYIYHDVTMDYDELLESLVEDLDDEYTAEEYNAVVDKADRIFEARIESLKAFAEQAKSATTEEVFKDLILAELAAHQYELELEDDNTDTAADRAEIIANAITLAKEEYAKTEADEDEKMEQPKDDAEKSEQIAYALYVALGAIEKEDVAFAESNDALYWIFINDDTVEKVAANVGEVFVTETDLDGTKVNTPNVVAPEKDADEDEDGDNKDEDDATTEETTTEEETTEAETTEEDKDGDDNDNDKEEEKTSQYAKKSYSTGAYYLTKAAARKDNDTINIGYVIADVAKDGDKDAETVKKELEDLMQAFLATDKTRESFKNLMKEKGYEDAYAILENYREGEFGYEEFDEWAYAENYELATGDVFEIESGSTDIECYYCFGFRFDAGEAEWYLEVKEDIVEEKYGDWEDQKEKEFEDKITMDEDTIRSIG